MWGEIKAFEFRAGDGSGFRLKGWPWLCVIGVMFGCESNGDVGEGDTSSWEAMNWASTTVGRVW